MAQAEANANIITHPLFATDPNQNYNQNGYADITTNAPPNVNQYSNTFMTPQQLPQQHLQQTMPPTNQTFQTKLPSQIQQYPSMQQQPTPPGTFFISFC